MYTYTVNTEIFHLFKVRRFKYPSFLVFLFKNLYISFSISSGENRSKLYRSMLTTSDISHSCFSFSVSSRVKNDAEYIHLSAIKGIAG